MTLDTRSPRVLRFATFAADVRAGELRRQGKRVKLQEQPFQVLVVLLQRAGNVVTREELRSQIWSEDTFVDFDNSLNTAINRIREALGDSADNPRFIETLPRRGYRFIGDVDIQTTTQSSLPEPRNKPANAGRPWTTWRPIGVAMLAVLVIAAIVAERFLWRRPSQLNLSIASPALQRLTTNSPQNPINSSAISPDGKYLAYSDETGVYLRFLATGELHSILSRTSKVTSLAWFPNGSQLVASWATAAGKKQLWALSFLGGNPRQLSDEGFAPSVSRDGSQIVFLKGADFADRGHEIWLMRSNGADQRKLVSFPEGQLSTPVWSPDGRWIAYVKRNAGPYAEETSIELFDVKQDTNRIILSDQQVTGWGMSWLPDARLVYAVYESLPNRDSSNFWAARIDLNRGRFLEAPTRITAGDGFVVQSSNTFDGKRLAFNRVRPQANVYVADFSAKQLRLGTPRQLTVDDADDLPFDWTLDSKAVLFVSNRTGTENIFLQRTDETSARMLFSDGERKTIGRLSPDGNQVLYLVSRIPGDDSQMVRLMQVPINGGPPKLVLEAPGLDNYQCSRAPANVCVFSQANQGDLVFSVFDLAVAKPRELGKLHRGGNWNWSFSPDGTLIAVTNFGADDNRIQVLPLSGRPAYGLAVKHRTGFNSVDWAADSKGLFVGSNPTGSRQTLLYVDLAGNAHEIWQMDSVQPGWAVPSRNGKYVAMPKTRINSNVWMTENF